MQGDEEQGKLRPNGASWELHSSSRSLCDGRQPVRGRCSGDGYTCTWNGGRRRSAKAQPKPSPTPGEHSCGAFRTYDSLVLSLRDKIPEVDQKALDLVLRYTRKLAESQQSLPNVPTPGPGQSPLHLRADGSECSQPSPSHRYLGQVSDVSFFNSVKCLMSATTQSDEMDSYEIEEDGIAEVNTHVAPDLPSREDADSFVNTCFSTIHVAYPFICQQAFLDQYR
jgi:hypothetical protein